MIVKGNLFDLSIKFYKTYKVHEKWQLGNKNQIINFIINEIMLISV